GPPAQTVSGSGTCCQVCPPSNEAAATTSWKGPWSQAATMLFGWTGFTTMEGSSVSSVGQVPNALNPVLHVPTALGRESSISEPPFWAATAASARGTAVAVGVVRSAQPAPSVAERTTLSIARI